MIFYSVINRVIENPEDETIHKLSMFIILIKTYCETESIPKICLNLKKGKDLERIIEIGR